MPKLNTVLGPVDASEIGNTMSHVHLTIDLLCWHQQPDSGVLRGMAEAKVGLDNLGWVRRNAMLSRDNLLQTISASQSARPRNTALRAGRRLSTAIYRASGATLSLFRKSRGPRGSTSWRRPDGTYSDLIRPRLPRRASKNLPTSWLRS
jgi:hypothetical protein